MKYQCGHNGCDLCGASQCGKYGRNLTLRIFFSYQVCDACIGLAVKFAYNAAATFGGTVIDVSKPCGNLTPPSA